MTLRIAELFGYAPGDASPDAVMARGGRLCPFSAGGCTKKFGRGHPEPSGVCSVDPRRGTGPVICCPLRLFGDGYEALRDVAEAAFGAGARIVHPDQIDGAIGDPQAVIVLGKGAGKEIRLPKKEGRGSFFVDWILVQMLEDGNIGQFVAVEIQTVDTSGNYRAEWEAHMQGRPFAGWSPAGLNWENVNKRILPQLIYKGHVLRREQLCRKGMFFACPSAVYDRILARLGHKLMQYEPHPGTLTFLAYDLGPPSGPGARRKLVKSSMFCTTVDQVALAFTLPADLPEENTYATAIRKALEDLRRRDR
jgi:hypothetical protein